MRMEGKVALVTGSTRGIGQATAERLAAEGAKVVVTGRDEVRGQIVAADICKSGGDAIFVRADLCREEDVKAAVDATVARYGKLTTLVNNGAATDVAIREDGPVTEISTESWNRILTVGLTAVMWTCRYAVPKMREAGGGSIVNVSSSTSVLANTGNDAYIATKGALNAITRSIAHELAPDNIRCNCIIPGFVVSNPAMEALMRNPAFNRAMQNLILMPPGKPVHIANAVLFVASDEAAYITGASLTVDGGLTCKQSVPEIQSLKLD